MTLVDLTLTGGDVSGSGGAIDSRETLILTGSTLSGNSAASSGGDIFGGLVTVTASTISGNWAWDKGGDIRARRGPVTIGDSIVAGNKANDRGRDILASTTVHYSLIGDNTGTSLAEAPVGVPDENGNLIGGPTNGSIDPLLAPLADNGGPTQTHARLPGSSATGPAGSGEFPFRVRYDG